MSHGDACGTEETDEERRSAIERPSRPAKRRVSAAYRVDCLCGYLQYVLSGGRGAVDGSGWRLGGVRA